MRVSNIIIGLILLVTFHTAILADTLDVTGFSWVGTPQLLRTSQVFGGEARQACGDQNFEVCVGTATRPAAGETAERTELIKCYIPRNSVNCPTVISADEQCFGVSEASPASVEVPACSGNPPAAIVATRGCHCGGMFYRGQFTIKQNRSECRAIAQRLERQRAAAAPAPIVAATPPTTDEPAAAEVETPTEEPPVVVVAPTSTTPLILNTDIFGGTEDSDASILVLCAGNNCHSPLSRVPSRGPFDPASVSMTPIGGQQTCAGGLESCNGQCVFTFIPCN